MPRWHERLNAAQKRRVERACELTYEHFLSYEKIAEAIENATGHSISRETIRGYLNSRQVPVNIAATLSELTGIPLFDFVPWLPHYCGGIEQ